MEVVWFKIGFIFLVKWKGEGERYYKVYDIIYNLYMELVGV